MTSRVLPLLGWVWLRVVLRWLMISGVVCLLRSVGTRVLGTWVRWGPVLRGRRLMVPSGWRW